MFLVRTIPNRWLVDKTYRVNIFAKRCKQRARVRLGPEVFEIKVDVHSYAHHELKVKAETDYILIEGRQERDIQDGYVIRRFAQKFKLPKGCKPDNMKSTLSPEGILTIQAKREYIDIDTPCLIPVPIKLSEGSPEEAIYRKSKRSLPCKKYNLIKVKPICPGTPKPKESGEESKNEKSKDKNVPKDDHKGKDVQNSAVIPTEGKGETKSDVALPKKDDEIPKK